MYSGYFFLTCLVVVCFIIALTFGILYLLIDAKDKLNFFGINIIFFIVGTFYFIGIDKLFSMKRSS
jgi:hypothetical protein